MDRRNEILLCATDLIQTFGFNGFSYNDIAERVGIRKASIHHHFANKEDLGVAFCDKKIEELNSFKLELEKISSAKKRLKAYLDKPKKRLETKKMCGINAMQSDCSSMTKSLQEKVIELTDLDKDIVVEILNYGKTNGELTFQGDAKESALVIVSALKGALQRSLLNNDNSYEKTTKALFQIFTP